MTEGPLWFLSQIPGESQAPGRGAACAGPGRGRAGAAAGAAARWRLLPGCSGDQSGRAEGEGHQPNQLNLHRVALGELAAFFFFH